MALRRQQKVLIGVIGLGATALLVDRVIVGYDATGPTTASAGITDIAPAAATASTVQPVASALSAVDLANPPVTPRNVIAERLAALEKEQRFEADELVDAFAAPEDWFAPTVVANPQQAAVTSPVEAFTSRYRLDAVVAGKANGFAVVNGRPVRPGEMVDNNPDIVLLHVHQRSAVFRVQGQEVELALRTPGGN